MTTATEGTFYTQNDLKQLLRDDNNWNLYFVMTSSQPAVVVFLSSHGNDKATKR